MDYKMIRLEQTEGIAVITLDYAPTLNALDMNMSLELEDALKKVETDPDLKIVVITGAGRAFCGTGDPLRHHGRGDCRGRADHDADSDFVGDDGGHSDGFQ